MANVEQLAQQLNQLEQELQQQHQRMQQVEAENARLRADGLGAPPQFIQVLRLRRTLEKKMTWREWSVKFESFVVSVYGKETRTVLAWAGEQDSLQDSKITERDVLDQLALCVSTTAHIT
eukprot:661819-Amphidinium_carterae.2